MADRRFFGLASVNAIVRGPTRPINIIIMITALPAPAVKSGVSPIDRPTVPKAENTSKTIFKNGAFSVIVNINNANSTNKKLITMMAKALKMVFILIALLNTTVSLFPLKKVIVAKIITINVVSLIPLPVDALPAPINIKTMINRRDGVVIWAISSVLNPAVLVSRLGSKRPTFCRPKAVRRAYPDSSILK